jgi:hypothetical protein
VRAFCPLQGDGGAGDWGIHHICTFVIKHRRLKHLLLAAALVISSFAFSQADSSRPHYMYSLISVGVGYGENLSKNPTTDVRPFWGTNGPTASASVLFAIKESYWGIAAVLGYSAPGFNLSAYAPLGFDTNKTKTFGGGNTAHYNIYYLLGGLNIKLPQRTTRTAFEVRVMIGPMICTLPALNYSINIPNGNGYQAYKVSTTSSTSTGIAMSPGIGIGQKLNTHLALMLYADVLYSAFVFHTTTTIISPNNPDQVSTNRSESVMEYGNLTATLSYSFGRIKPNITY